MKKTTKQISIAGDVVPIGNGAFRVIPRKPIIEVGPAEAARILHVATSSLPNLLDRPLAQKHIRWRWLSDAKGKRLYDTSSLYAYLATTDPELPKG